MAAFVNSYLWPQGHKRNQTSAPIPLPAQLLQAPRKLTEGTAAVQRMQHTLLLTEVKYIQVTLQNMWCHSMASSITQKKFQEAKHKKKKFWSHVTSCHWFREAAESSKEDRISSTQSVLHVICNHEHIVGGKRATTVSGFLVCFLTHSEPMSPSRLALALQHISLKQKGGAPELLFSLLQTTCQWSLDNTFSLQEREQGGTNTSQIHHCSSWESALFLQAFPTRPSGVPGTYSSLFSTWHWRL